MPIELLWIIPIIAGALIGLILVLNLQKNSYTAVASGPARDLKKEVNEYNQGFNLDQNIGLNAAENRFMEIERTIKQVSAALSNQQSLIENFNGKDSKLSDELDRLKQKLKELQDEYDITISENFSLRARLRRIEEKSGRPDDPRLGPGPMAPADSLVRRSSFAEETAILNKKTTFFNRSQELDYLGAIAMEDTSEINLKDLGAPRKSSPVETPEILPRTLSDSTTSSYLKDISLQSEDNALP